MSEKNTYPNHAFLCAKVLKKYLVPIYLHGHKVIKALLGINCTYVEIQILNEIISYWFEIYFSQKY